ncbi:hypothetical protein PAHAL_6G161700 [Panicum hallii]|jgi:hypothetical protein|uniref:Uncharacterized protein n=1 Tax=Panicum hallii TaxID=206008 RepID=A0A2T8IGL5_9POAL|nr:hypothetical protein PAHAL_6G143800 [Panicum hallii]PVH36756.1 hypothetical protein PAHAL_6G161700 [Panicum hallii]
MADNGWVNGVCYAEPGLPKLLLLSLERVGVMETPEYAYREYISGGTLRCDTMIFVERSTRYPDVDPWFISTKGFRFPDTYRKAARKALRRLRVLYRHHLQRTPMGFFPPTEGRGRTWIARMRGLGREEEDLEDTVSHLSIYLTGLDALCNEQAAQLKKLIHGVEKLTQELEEQRTRAATAEYSLAALQAQMQVYETRNGIGGWIEEEEEEEPMETHWDKGTQTENEMDRFLPIKKRSIRTEEESP